jgi:chemotaxis protein methyltransferase CheR
MTIVSTDIAKLTWPQFIAISSLVKERCGINLHEGKIPLIEARLRKRLTSLGYTDFGQYLERINNDIEGRETASMLDALSTNVTYFFREHHHFGYMVKTLLPKMKKRHESDHKIRIWSAGCSSGEEPYSISILLNNAMGHLADWDLRILATDLSRKVLGLAKKAKYEPQQLRYTPQPFVRRFFTHVKEDNKDYFMVKEYIRKIVDFAHLNLMGKWPMKGPFDLIFFRNVMIYFDKPTQEYLINKFWEMLVPGGMLFIGHSESMTGINNKYKYIQPAIYQKPVMTQGSE